jgi:hypothetical protein
MRQNLREGILQWAAHRPHDGIAATHTPPEEERAAQSVGIPNAMRALGRAANVRLKREVTMVRFRKRARVDWGQSRAKGFPGLEAPRWSEESKRDSS